MSRFGKIDISVATPSGDQRLCVQRLAASDKVRLTILDEWTDPENRRYYEVASKIDIDLSAFRDFAHTLVDGLL